MRGTIPRSWMEVRARPEWLGATIGAAALLLFAIAFAAALTLGGMRRAPGFSGVRVAPPAPAAAPAPPREAEAMTPALLEPLQDRLQPLTREQALAYNASIPVSTAPNPPARRFAWSPSPVDRARAEDCLTAAVYHEAGFEPAAGMRAIAQVVLNRVRHFAYPKTVCGVVFQGAERASGCQFTFTCDGALDRPVAADGWERARGVARAALAGHVERAVGDATHYHADYVAPYWQPTLLKVAVIGHHIFYRGADGWGAPAAFAGRYAGGEPAMPAAPGATASVPVVTLAAPAAAPAAPVTIAPPPPPPPPPPKSASTRPIRGAAPAPNPAAEPAPAAPAPQRPHAPVARRLPIASG